MVTVADDELTFIYGETGDDEKYERVTGKAIRNIPMNIRVFTVVFALSLGLIVVSAAIGNILKSKGILTEEMLGSRGVNAVLIFYVGLFCIMAFSLVPLALRFFINMQVKIGHGELFPIKWLQAHEQLAVFGFWGLVITGLVIIIALVKPTDMFK